jgi:hypothetical protein
MQLVQSVLGLYSIDDMIINEHGAVGGMRIGRRNRSARGNPPQFHFVHHKSHMT